MAGVDAVDTDVDADAMRPPDHVAGEQRVQLAHHLPTHEAVGDQAVVALERLDGPGSSRTEEAVHLGADEVALVERGQCRLDGDDRPAVPVAARYRSAVVLSMQQPLVGVVGDDVGEAG